MKNYDVIVVGASVAGSRTAELISSKGYKVLVLEEHEKIDKPIKCTGLVSWRLLKLLPNLPEDVIVNTVNKAKFFSPNGNCFELKSKKSVYVIDRYKLDRHLYERVKEERANVKLSTRFNNFRYFDDGIEAFTNKGKFEGKLLVGADGANSQVANKAGIKRPDDKLVGLQATVHGSFDPSTVELWFGSIAPNFFAWAVPESETVARVGLATKINCKNDFEKFLKKRIGKILKPDVGGNIPFGLIETSVSDRILLVGDAAYQIKPFSGGGIVYGLIASEYCASACVKALEQNQFDSNFLGNEYDKKWKEKLEKPIRKGLKYRKILNKLSDKQLNFLFSVGKLLRLTKVLESWDMDLLGKD